MLNNDVLLVKGWLEKAVEAFESDERIGSVGSWLIGFEDAENTPAPWTGLRERQTLCGAAMIIKRKALDHAGYLDDRNFSPAYGEETDWCYRARNAGFKLVESSESVVKHYGSGSTLKQLPKPNQYTLMNTHRLKAMLYNLSFLEFLRHVPGLGLIFVQSFGNGMFFYLLKSYWNNIKNIPNILKRRVERRKLAKETRKSLWQRN